MQTDKNKTPVGNCVRCGKGAQWNAPGLDPNGNLFCNTCVDNDRSGVLFTSINQFKINNQYQPDGGVVLNGVVVWKDKSTWTEGGTRAVTLMKHEETLSPFEIATLINEEHNVQEITRCTGCGTKMTQDQIAGYPLFAGVCCAPCMEKHKQSLDNERKTGHVCGMCGQPYGNCCC